MPPTSSLTRLVCALLVVLGLGVTTPAGAAEGPASGRDAALGRATTIGTLFDDPAALAAALALVDQHYGAVHTVAYTPAAPTTSGAAPRELPSTDDAPVAPAPAPGAPSTDAAPPSEAADAGPGAAAPGKEELPAFEMAAPAAPEESDTVPVPTGKPSVTYVHGGVPGAFVPGPSTPNPGGFVPGASCSTAPPALHPNGQLPDDALCSLETAPSHRLLPSAAAAYDALSRAYEADFGRPMCITDSYRTYAAQVDLRARKPSLAAVPGTSNHGWGRAVDLCGGIQSFGTAQHEWMKENAPLFGWVHPRWAQVDGSKPEAWHWEYEG